jgi:molybdopterin-guanine dinucleotide biosynthesis protein A
MDRSRVTGVVLAGGGSSRLGRDKAMLQIGGQPLLTRAVRLLHTLAEEVLVLGPPERAAHAPDARVIPDQRPGDGPLPALATALREMRGDRLVAVATDMPFLNVDLLRFLLDRADAYDVVVPRVGDRTQQLHAVYARACLPVITAQLERNDLKFDRFFTSVRTLIVEEAEVAWLDPGFLSFRNINTEADWAAVQGLAGAQMGGRR